MIATMKELLGNIPVTGRDPLSDKIVALPTPDVPPALVPTWREITHHIRAEHALRSERARAEQQMAEALSLAETNIARIDRQIAELAEMKLQAQERLLMMLDDVELARVLRDANVESTT
jgi:hypothetical protein